MCGRFTLRSSPRAVAEAFGLPEVPDLSPRFPERGTALVFYHRQVHEGQPVLRGRKYVLRTDVRYRRARE